VGGGCQVFQSWVNIAIGGQWVKVYVLIALKCDGKKKAIFLNFEQFRKANKPLDILL